MSDSEIEVSGQSAATDPETAVREALSSLGRALAAKGGAPFHLSSMEWLAADLSAFDPKRHVLDLAFREVLGGFRPPITVVKTDKPVLAIRARAVLPLASTEPVWHGYALPELAREYSPRGQVPNMDALFAQWSRDGLAFCAGRSGLAITFVSGREFFLVRQIENFTRQRLRSGQIPSEGEIERAKENQLLQRVRTTLQSGEFPRRDHFIETLLEEGFDSVAIASASLHLLTGGAEPEAAKSEPKSMSAKPALPSGPAPAPALAAPRPAVSPIARPPAIAASKAPAPPRPVIAPAPNGVDESGFQDGESTSAIGALPAVDRPAASATAPEPKVAKPAVAKAPVKRALAAPATMSAPPKPALRSSTWDRPAFSENRPPSVGRPAPVARPEPFRPGADRPAQRPMQEQRPPVDRQRERDPMRPSPEPLPEARPVEMTMMPVWLGVGQREKITPEEVITCIQGHTGLPASVVGGIEIHEEHTLVDVTGEHARGVVLKLKHGLFRGKPLRAKLANR